MKGLFVLLFSGAAVTATAQLPNAELKRITEKNLRLLHDAELKQKFSQPVTEVIVSSRVFNLRQDRMPCVVPDTKHLVAIPNALPEFSIPSVAAIPNPVLNKNLQESKIISVLPSK